MRAVRPILCVAVATALSATGVAQAAKPKPKPKPPPPVCNLVVDPAGDASLRAPVPSDDALDILSADVASDAKTFTAVIRVKSIAASGANQIGHVLRMNFGLTGSSDTPYLAWTTTPAGDVFDWGVTKTSTGANSIVTSGKATGTVDKTKNEVHINVPISDLKSLGKVAPGSKITSLQAVSEQMFGTTQSTPVFPGGVYATEQIDTADGTKNYVAGFPSCVTPGT